MALTDKHCQPLVQGQATLSDTLIESYLSEIDSQWELVADNTTIQHSYHFKDFHKTMAFVNAVAWIAHQQDHHPDIQLGYNYCTLQFTSHAAQGLTENDFICAAKVDLLAVNS
ncbi:MAG: 4a-hydroxytetrahydrobiopterin dehydratase [Gammaproteobacteria bacterium]|nr:4a-hydroxytetrahydrobiopterin dehydratase [Gammaproteobacteria bacterium]